MDYENILSRKVQDLQFSGIRKFFDIAASYDDVISLSVGEPDFKTCLLYTSPSPRDCS